MAGFFQKLKGSGSGVSKSDATASAKSKKDEPQPDLTPVEKLLQNAGPVRQDGSDKFFGLENFGNTCYCNSIVQALYHSDHFRDNVVNYPPPSPWGTSDGTGSKPNVTIRPPVQPNGTATGSGKPTPPPKPRQSSFSGGQLAPTVPPIRPEDKPDSPEYKKKQAMIKGPVLELARDDAEPYGMEESTFTGLKDIFTALIDSPSRTGVLSPQRFLDIFKRNNEMFRNSMHQDAHEFYGIVLNDVIANVEANGKRMQELEKSKSNGTITQATGPVLTKNDTSMALNAPGTGWVHDIFEGVLVSETRCLTCETTSQRDETFLDLSIDLEEHSSVTSCLQQFSAEEMLCERNKFHCDHCGGLQEAEKRMKVKKLPKVLALHLKRFKYTEDYSRLQKLFHRVVYPYHLRLLNTTDDAEDPDRMYELYAVVVHIGGNAYHGHYVAVIKTKDRGWLLFDDEMVEPVDKNFVQNFFGDKPGMACAYVLFYQETTFEKVREELDAEGIDQVKMANQAADLAATVEQVNGTSSTPLSKLNSQPLPPLSPVGENEKLAALSPTKSTPIELDIASPVDQPLPPLPQPATDAHPLVAAPPPAPAVMTKADEAATVPPKTKKELAKEKKELKAREKAEEKARKAAEVEQARVAAKERQEALQRIRDASRLEREQLQQAIEESRATAAEEEKRLKKGGGGGTPAGDENGGGGGANGFLNRAGRTSKSMTRKSFAFLHLGLNNNNNNKDDSAAKRDSLAIDRTDRSEESGGDNRSEMGESSAAGESNHHQQHNHDAPKQNGTNGGSGGGKHGHVPPLPTEDKDRDKNREKDKLGLKKGFSFGLGKKRSSKFSSAPPPAA